MRSVSEANRQKQEKGQRNLTQAGRQVRIAAAFLLLIVLLLLSLIWSACSGSVSVPLMEFLEELREPKLRGMAWTIIWEIRLPRALAALILGGALALSGYLLQTFFHNPIAGPFVLGISSGSKLLVALVMVGFLEWNITINSGMLVAAAFAGALLSMLFVLLVARKMEQMAMLIVGGVMIGYICSAITDFVVTFASDADIVNLHNWSRGSFSGMTWENVAVMAGVTFVSAAAVFLLSKPIGAYQMGETYAKSMGVSVAQLRFFMVILSSILSGCVAAFAGPVSFVGIAVPHLIRWLFADTRPLVLIPGCFLGGSVFCLISDWLARTVFAPTELSISTVTAVFGAPVVIFVMMRKHRKST
ncbi:iron ABC transporter permease [Clostridium sp. AF50-3]|uniref:FecCD family ABC transporter permease n=1 Tax=Clostridium sp. AF50-3 TaxID=2293021 RepID=UPI000E4820D9|nr:iron ABC transporter permease [Clostridium sp. AF50-3]RHO66872.1 iron ABC transporter permease [Clostridium sp. AF50-3]